MRSPESHRKEASPEARMRNSVAGSRAPLQVVRFTPAIVAALPTTCQKRDSIVTPVATNYPNRQSSPYRLRTNADK
jgi:hypothetical protein